MPEMQKKPILNLPLEVFYAMGIWQLFQSSVGYHVNCNHCQAIVIVKFDDYEAEGDCECQAY